VVTPPSLPSREWVGLPRCQSTRRLHWGPSVTRSVDTIIVNFRTKELTLDAARSVLSEPETNSVIVVENGSGDGSREWLRDQLAGSPGANVVDAEKNLGFGGGNNLGGRAATAEYVFLLNSDATLEPGGLAPLVKCLENPSVGVVAPAVVLANGYQVQPDAQGIFPTPGAILSRRAAKQIDSLEPDWVTGAAMMMRRTEFLDLGGFDENLFMYLEDVDLCKRYRDRGLRVVRELSSKVIHLGGGSKESTRAQKEQFARSTDYYLKKHGFGRASRTAVKVVRAAYRMLRGV
jgi:N-acetylglucosaminyl-diphospho-decaprenol L-rhamnosyltransferase